MRRLLVLSFVIFLLVSFISNDSIAQWQQAAGPYGGGVTCLSSQDTVVFAGTISGIYASADEGLTWVNKSKGLPTTFIETIYSTRSGLFVGCFEGVFRSTDNGDNWNRYSNGINTDYVFAITGLDTSLFAGTMNGVYKSDDGGENWARVDSGFTGSMVFNFAVQGSYLFAGTDEGVYMTSDQGDTWTFANNGITGGTINAMCVYGRTKVFAGTAEGVFVSEDHGSTWSPISNGLTPPSVYTLSLLSDKLFAGVKSNGAFVSTDFGNTWNPVDPSLDNPYINDFLQVRDKYYAASDNSVYRSIDSVGTWTKMPVGMMSTSVRAFLNLDTEIIAGTLGAGAFVSSDSGKTWIQYENLNVRAYKGFAKNDSALFAATATDGLQKSTNNGTTWERILTSVRDSYFRTVNANKNLVFAVSFSNGAYRSSDYGVTWEPLSATLTDPDIENFTFTDSLTIYASTLSSGFIFKSTDGGLSWLQSSNGLGNYSSTHNIIKLNNLLFTASGDGVYRSDDDGKNWSLVINGMTSTSVLTISSFGSTLFTGTVDGYFYKSTDNGNNWIDISEGLPPYGSSSANEVISLMGNNILCGTYSTGIFWRPLNEVVTSVNNELPSNALISFELSQNYPNPFNPNSTIKFQLPKSGMVTLKIYDILGNEVATLVNEEKVSGKYEVNFNASALASGVYIYKIQSGDFISSKKMVLLK